MGKLFDVVAFVGAVMIAISIHAPDPSALTRWIASLLIVTGALVILMRDIERWRR